MKFKTGDKVRFLNTSGGGIITKIISPSMVCVAIEDGFEIPTLTSELIRIEIQDTGSRFFNKISESPSTSGADDIAAEHSKSLPPEEYKAERVFPLRKIKGSESGNVWLAFRPHDQKWLITGLLDICLLNPTDYDILYSFLLRHPDNQYSGMDYDILPSESGITIVTVTREDLHSWLEGCIQMIFQKELFSRLIMPVNAAYRLKPARFLKEDNYVTNAFIAEKALLINLSFVMVSEPDPEPAKISVADQEFESQIIIEKPKSLIDKHRVAPFEAEVDLHISALKENFTKFSQFEILKIQTDYFTQCIESALECQYRKVIFIHGIGNGTLRNALLEMVRQYEELQVQNASFKKYGYGAIEVINKTIE